MPLCVSFLFFLSSQTYLLLYFCFLFRVVPRARACVGWQTSRQAGIRSKMIESVINLREGSFRFDRRLRVISPSWLFLETVSIFYIWSRGTHPVIRNLGITSQRST